MGKPGQSGDGRSLAGTNAPALPPRRDRQKLAGQSLRAIAGELDRRAIKSWSGKPWNAVSVRNAMVPLGFQTTSGAS
jgi:hypothetical protein